MLTEYFVYLYKIKNIIMSNVKYKETQRYENNVVLGVLSISAIFLISRAFNYLIAKEPVIVNAILLTTFAILIGAVILWLRNLKLKIAISDKNVKFKLSPIHPKKHSISWSEIDSCNLIRTSEASQWSGGNITFHREKRYSLTGRNGLAIKTKSGQYFFIGSSNLSGLSRFLDQMSMKHK